MGHGDWFQVQIRKGRKWKSLPYCASRAQVKGVLAQHVNVEYRISINGRLIDHQKPYKGGYVGKLDQAGYPTLGKKKP